jgi:hypothetical protein
MFKILITGCFLFLTSCLVVESSNNGSSGSSSVCIDAEPVTTNAVQVTFRFPKSAESVEVLRNGLVVYSTTNSQATTFIDTPLEEGLTYLYSCRMIDSYGDPIADKNQISVETDASSAPSFAGINSTTIESDSSASAHWLTPGAGVIARSYRVYYGFSNSATEVFGKAPLATVNSATVKEALLENLGDGLTYHLGVRACSSSGTCDANEVLRTVTIPDRGAPQTVGATAVELQTEGANTVVRITAPWDHTLGEVAVRQIYHAKVAYQTACPTLLSTYTAANGVPFVASNPAIVIQPLVGAILENETHCFIVRDRDTQGNENQNLNIVKVDVGDITAPDTNAIQLYVNRSVSNPETRLVASWTSMLNETENALTGASAYRLYVSSATYPQNPDADPCTNGTLRAEINASFYPSGQAVSYTIDNLTPRTNYRVCLKVVDSSSNTGLVLAKHNILESTGDVTPPAFFGITSATLNIPNVGLDIGFTLSTSPDIYEYKIRVVKIPSNETIEITKSKPLQASGTYILQATLAELQLNDNDIADIYVNACDNAQVLGFNASNNCTATVAKVQVTIPDTLPPQGFTGVLSAVPGVDHRSIQVNWNAPADWSGYAGFKVYYVNAGSLVNIDSSNCVCAASNCSASPVTSCLVNREESGTLLTPSKQYEIYVSAYDLTGNQTTSYISYSGGSKVTAITRAKDLEVPIFNANIEPMIFENSGAKLKFSSATDTQDPTLQIRYEIYRKTNATFTCPLAPNTSAGGCDNLAPRATVNGADLVLETGKFVYSDTTVTDGNTYYYQICALDFASNRACQQGTIPSLSITDITLPVISNVDSNKQWAASGNTSWQITFTPTDNIATPSQLVLRAYKSATAYPNQSNPGVPTFSSGSGTITISGGVATFTDTGLANGETAYYLIEVQDLAGNKAYATLRDMLPAPTITSVTWSDPLTTAGYPDITANQYSNASTRQIRINGTNLSSVQLINEASIGATDPHYRICNTSRIASKTNTLILCNFSGTAVYWTTNYHVYVADKHGRIIDYNAGSPVTYCAWAQANGITNIRGLGTAAAPFVLCRPEHFAQIGQNVGGVDIKGYIYVGADLDLSSVSGFTGIDVIAGEFFMDGAPNLSAAKTISNLTIDTSATNADAAIVKNCTGSTAIATPMFNKLKFNNITVRSGTGKAAVLVANKNCQFTSVAQNFVDSVDITNSNIYANNSAGFVAAVYNSTNDGMASVNLFDSKIYSTRASGFGAVGGLVGVLEGAPVSIPAFNTLVGRNVDLLPATGQSTSGDNIGGLFGRVDISRSQYQQNYIAAGQNGDVTNLISGAGSNIGGVFGSLSNSVYYFKYYTASQNKNVTIDNSGSLTKDNRGGIIGGIGDLASGAQVLLENIGLDILNISGGSNLGGFIGGGIQPRILSIIGTSNTINTYSIIATGNNVGGVIGSSGSGTILIDSLVSSHTSGLNQIQSAGSSVGGLIGLAGNLTISNSRFFRGNVTGSTVVGGLLGNANKTDVIIFKSAVHESDILGTTNAGYVGGFIGSSFQRSVDIQQSGIGESHVGGVAYVGGLIGRTNGNSSLTFLDNYVGYGLSLTTPVVEGNNNTGGLIGSIYFGSANSIPINISRNAVNGIVYATGANNGTFFGSYGAASSAIVVANNYYRNDYSGVGRLNTNAYFTAAGEISGMNVTQASTIGTYVGWSINASPNYSGVWFLDPATNKARLSSFSSLAAQYGL